MTLDGTTHNTWQWALIAPTKAIPLGAGDETPIVHPRGDQPPLLPPWITWRSQVSVEWADPINTNSYVAERTLTGAQLP